MVWGRPRFTADLDIVVELHADKVDPLQEELMALSEASYISIDAIEEVTLAPKIGAFKTSHLAA